MVTKPVFIGDICSKTDSISPHLHRLLCICITLCSIKQWFFTPLGGVYPTPLWAPLNTDSTRHSCGVSYRHTTYLVAPFICDEQAEC